MPAPAFPWNLNIEVQIAILLGVVLLVVGGLWLLLRKSPAKEAAAPPDLRVDVKRLGLEGPPRQGPQLEFYGVPVRLAAVILAPAGRIAQLPTPETLTACLNNLLPGLGELAAQQQAIIKLWPSQLSTAGFISSFYYNVELPDGGKGTPWSTAAGRFDDGSQQLLAGVLCAAAKPNSYGQVEVKHLGQWMDVLRVKKEEH